VTLDEVLAHLRAMTASVDIPFNADFEGGFAVEPADVAVERDRGDGDRNCRPLDRGLDG
jgi:hypothetical protein